MKTSPMQRSLKMLRRDGWQVAILERWNQYAKVRQDCWGFGDLLACRPSKDPLDVGTIALIQTTTAANMAARREKILSIPQSRQWKLAGGMIILHGWKKGPKNGVRGAVKVWSCREENL